MRRPLTVARAGWLAAGPPARRAARRALSSSPPSLSPPPDDHAAAPSPREKLLEQHAQQERARAAARRQKLEGRPSADGVFKVVETSVRNESVEVVSSKLRYRAPRKVWVLDDSPNRDALVRRFSQATGALWRGDYALGRKVLSSVSRYFQSRFSSHLEKGDTPAENFRAMRKYRAEQAARTSFMMLEVESGFAVRAKKVPEEISEALDFALGPEFKDRRFFVPFPEVLGMASAHNWFKTGIEVPALDDPEVRIRPHYSVFPPTRQDYVPLLTKVSLPTRLDQVVEVGTGSGVLTAVLLRKCGVDRVIGTDTNVRAIETTRATLAAFGLEDRADLIHAPLLPAEVAQGQTADLIVCNPAWLPGRPSSVLESAIYDDQDAMVRKFIRDASKSLRPDTGRIFLFMSDLAELAGMRPRGFMDDLIYKAGLEVVESVATEAAISDRKVPSIAAARKLKISDFRDREVVTLYSLRRRETTQS